MTVREVHIDIPAQDVIEGDMLHGLPVSSSLPTDIDSGIWEIRAFDNDTGIQMLVSSTHPLSIIRQVPVGDTECVICGKPRKYKNLCAAHYAAKRRAARSVPGSGQAYREPMLPYQT